MSRMIELPESMKRAVIISAERVALALVGEPTTYSIGDIALGWEDGHERQAEAYQWKNTILSKAKVGELDVDYFVVIRESKEINIAENDLLISDTIIDAQIFTNKLWPWLLDEQPENKIRDYIDPRIEIESQKNKFISIHELISTLQTLNPELTHEIIAEWLVKRLCHDSDIELYKQEIAGKLSLYQERQSWGGIIPSKDFLTSLLNAVIEEGESVMNSTHHDYSNEPPMDFSDDIPF